MAIGTIAFSQNAKSTINKNGMEVSWYYAYDKIHFEMRAPTDGWVTIGFNSHAGMGGAYLIMGNIIESNVNVVEHYTISPGNYKPIESFGLNSNVNDIMGSETKKSTYITFSLPIKADDKYRKNLEVGQKYILTMAYSREDDFQHHSMMRTSEAITL